jgi:4-hydroxy-3-polyprenylbenzoate decarboxylase
MVDQTLGRVLDLFGLDAGTVRRWGEPPEEGVRPLRAKPKRA